MTLNETLFAVLDSDNKVCGDGECPALTSDREYAEHGMEYVTKHYADAVKLPLRIAVCKLVEITNLPHRGD